MEVPYSLVAQICSKLCRTHIYYCSIVLNVSSYYFIDVGVRQLFDAE